MRPGVPVVAGTSSGGKVKVTLAGDVALEGKIDADALGMRSPRTASCTWGRPSSGASTPGPWSASARQDAGALQVTAIGAVQGKLEVASDALTAEPVELVYPPIEGLRLGKAGGKVSIYPTKKRKGSPRSPSMRTPGWCCGEESGGASRVTTYGGVEVEVDRLERDRGAGEDQVHQPGGSPVKPTHEIFATTAFYLAPGKKGAGQLYGGTLVELTREKSGEYVKVTTAGPVTVEGWVRAADVARSRTRC